MRKPLPLTMNLLPQIYRPWRPSARQIYIFIAVMAIIALLFPTYNLISNVMTKTSSLKSESTVLNSGMVRRQAELARRQPLQNFLVAHQTINDMGGGFIEDLKVITDTAEKFGIEIPTITHSGESITIPVKADSSIVFREFLTALQESERFASVTIPAKPFPDITESMITIIPKK